MELVSTASLEQKGAAKIARYLQMETDAVKPSTTDHTGDKIDTHDQKRMKL